jgi:hypothetical protein
MGHGPLACPFTIMKYLFSFSLKRKDFIYFKWNGQVYDPREIEAMFVSVFGCVFNLFLFLFLILYRILLDKSKIHFCRAGGQEEYLLVGLALKNISNGGVK